MARKQLTRRFFLAVFPPARITGGIADLGAKGPKDWDWKAQADYHISLAFPGNLTAAEQKKLIKALRDFDFRPFKLSFESMGVFAREPEESRSKKHVLWARPDIAADNALRALHNKLAHFLKQRGFSYGLRQITPHLTVAKSEGAPELMEDFAAANMGLKTPVWHCDRIELRETLNRGSAPEGGRYKKVTEFLFRP